MAYLLTHFWPDGSEDQYRTMQAHVHPEGGLPDGQTHHVAGPTDGGYLIAAVWESKDHADRFVNDVLLAKLPIAGGFEGPPEERVAEVSNLETR